MSELIPANFGAVSARFANVDVNDDLSSGVQSSFGIIGYKGKVWSIRYRGDEKQLMRDDGDGPRNSIEVVIIKASPHVSKIWYEQGYVEGSNAAPDCFSNNGITPEPTATKPQCASCQACPHNQWGSRITPAGKAGKACSDSKRLAVVPLDDPNNEMFGGPMLLRVPAASLQDVAMYGQKMQQMGYPYFAVGTKISFDAEESYPKFIFKGLRPLNDAEADVIVGLRDSHSVERIMAESEFSGGAPAPTQANDDEPLFEQAPEVGAKTISEKAIEARDTAAGKATKPRQTKAKTEAPPKVEPIKEEPVVEATADAGEDEEDAEIAAMLAKAAALKKAKEEKRLQEEYAAKALQQNKERAAAEATKGPTPEELAARKKAEEKAAKLEAARAALAAAEAEDGDEEEDSGPGVQLNNNGNAASSFEADLDSMLEELLP